MTERMRSGKRIISGLGLGIGVIGIAFVIRVVASQWVEVIAAFRAANLFILVAAFGVGLVGMAQIGLGWRRCLALLGGQPPPPVGDSLYWYFVGQLGKYIPGGIWPVVGRSEMARQGGVSGQQSYASTLVSLGVTYLAAILLTVALLPWTQFGGGGDEVISRSWVLVLLPIGLVVLQPAVMMRLLLFMQRISGRRIRITPPPWLTMVRLLFRHIPAWLAIGLATWAVGVALDAPGELSNVIFATSLSWVVGFVIIPVPGGIGVREAVFVAAATSLPSALAATVALTARLLFIAVDLTGAAVSSTLRTMASNRR